MSATIDHQPSSAFWVLTVTWAAGLVASGAAPYDRGTWLMEVAPAIIAWPILFAT